MGHGGSGVALRLLATAVLLAACSSSDDGLRRSVPAADDVASSPASRTSPGPGDPLPTLHCALDDACPEVLIAGDPHATLPDGTPAPFRGYGDPSLEAGADGTLWLAYSWLETLVTDAGAPDQVDFGVRTHLARSTDDGATFTFVTPLNDAPVTTHPVSGVEGYLQREVPSIVREDDGTWRLWHFDYFDPFGGGPENRSDFFFSSATAPTPEALAGRSQPVLAGRATPAALGGGRSVADVVGLERCVTGTEPGLLAYRGTTWLALHCLVIGPGGERRPADEEIALLRMDRDGALTYVGPLLRHADAEAMGTDVHTQPDLYVARDGTVQLLVTPKVLGGSPEHRGCVVYRIADLDSASVVRDEDGTPLARIRITAEGSGLGPGLCTYDAASETGILLVITDFDLSSQPPRLRFSLRRTGVHP